MAGKISDNGNRFALDLKGAQDIRAKFQQDPKAGLQAAAQEFESLFLQMVLKSMRDTVPTDGMLNSEQSRFYTSMLDQQLAQNLSGARGLGFAKMIEQQLGRQLSNPAGAQENPAAAAGSALPLAASNARHVQSAMQPQVTQPWMQSPSVASMVPGGDSSGPSARDFVNQVWPHAVEASRSTGIPPQFLVAHAALESGWGRSEMRKADGSPTYNLFGIKAGKSWTGATADVPTTEYVNGEAQKVTASFRAYSSYAEAFTDYANLLRNNQRFGAVIGSQDGTEFARRLQQAGYATDPMYADKLARIINGPTLRMALVG